jgi:hypothetical protein
MTAGYSSAALLHPHRPTPNDPPYDGKRNQSKHLNGGGGWFVSMPFWLFGPRQPVVMGAAQNDDVSLLGHHT